MSAQYSQIAASVNPDGLTVHCSFLIENRSQKPWRAEEGFHLGWQLYDPDTGLFISEGEWAPLSADLPAGGKTNVSLDLKLPTERGRYHLYISPVATGDGWFYAKGQAFVLVEAEVERQRATVLSSRRTTLASLQWNRRLASIHKAFTLPVTTAWRNRGLIRSMVGRDMAARYRGSVGDVAWTVLNPLLLMITYFFVFGIVLRARFPGDPSREGFALYFLAGMLTWLPFSEAAGRAPSLVLEHRNFVKKLVFPIETLPINITIAGLVTQAFALAVFLVFFLVARGTLYTTALWLPVLIVPQLLFTLGVSWFLAALGVFLRDLGQVMGYLLTLWFFITPICYPEDALPAAAVPILSTNPIFVLVRGFRAVLIDNQAPAFGPLWKLWIFAAAVCVLGHAWFHKLQKSFADTM